MSQRVVDPQGAAGLVRGPAAAPPGRDTSADGRPAARRVRHGGLFLVAGSLALGLASLLLPSTPTYDPWAWILWGREILQLDLDTTVGPSWKPLPALFTVPFALAGDAAPELWLAVARAGGVLAVAMCARLAWRLAGPPYGLLAGVVAGGGLIASSYFVRTVALGNSEGLLVAAILGAIDRHLDGRWRQAFGLAVAAALLRPETWPFVALYGGWLWLRRLENRWLLGGAGILVLALWFLPELWGSGALFRSADRANAPTNPNSPAFAENPAIALLNQVRPVLLLPFKLGVLVAIAIAVVEFLRRRRDGLALALALGMAAWIAGIAAMTGAGYSGNPRYLMPATAVGVVLAGYGYVRVLGLADRAVARLTGDRRVAAGAVAALAIATVVAAVPFVAPRAERLRKLAAQLHYQALLRRDLDAAIERVGGPGRVLACGHPTTGPYQVPAVAWHLTTPMRAVGSAPASPGIVFQTRATRRAPPQPQLPPEGPRYRPIAVVGTWQLLSASCAGGPRAAHRGGRSSRE